jgi:DNA ligase-1
MTFPALYKLTGSRASTRPMATQLWFVTVDEYEGSWTSHSGLVDGKMTRKTTISKPKNIGKANETTPAQQACLEAKAAWTFQVERELYKENLNDGAPPLYTQPMLALDAAKNPHRVHWGKRRYVTQPKLNGVRFTGEKVAEGVVHLTSRKGVRYNVPHIQAALNHHMIVGGTPVDGELYLGEEYELGDVTGALKPGTENHLKLEAHLFDMVHPDYTFEWRYTHLVSMFGDNRITANEPLKLVPAELCATADIMELRHDVFVGIGYEGIMIRDLDGLYDYGEKNEFLYKFKKFQDEEFWILGIVPDKDGTGGLCVMQTDNRGIGGHFEGTITEPTFTCRCKGTNEYRAHQLAHPEEYIGKLLTVRFSNKLKSGVPEFNRGIAIRDYE